MGYGKHVYMSSTRVKGEGAAGRKRREAEAIMCHALCRMAQSAHQALYWSFCHSKAVLPCPFSRVTTELLRAALPCALPQSP